MGVLCCTERRNSIDDIEDVLDAEQKSPEQDPEVVEIKINDEEDLEVVKAEADDSSVIEKQNLLSESTTTVKPADDDSFERMIFAEDVELVLISPKQKEQAPIKPSTPNELPEKSLPPQISLSPVKSTEFSTEDPTELLPDLDQFQLIITDESTPGTRELLCDTKSQDAEKTQKLNDNDTPTSKDGDVTKLVNTESSGIIPPANVPTPMEKSTPIKPETSDDPQAALAEYVQKREIIQDFYDANLKKPQSPQKPKSSIYAGIKVLEDQFQRKRKILQDYHDQEMAKIDCPVKKRDAGQKLTMELLRIDHEEDTSRFRIIQSIMDYHE